MSDDRPNFAALPGGGYVVRTQAGLKQAMKAWAGPDSDIDKWDTDGHPTSYPSVVHFYTFYHGYHGAGMLSEHVNHAVEQAERRLAVLRAQ